MFDFLFVLTLCEVLYLLLKFDVSVVVILFSVLIVFYEDHYPWIIF